MNTHKKQFFFSIECTLFFVFLKNRMCLKLNYYFFKIEYDMFRILIALLLGIYTVWCSDAEEEKRPLLPSTKHNEIRPAEPFIPSTQKPPAKRTKNRSQNTWDDYYPSHTPWQSIFSLPPC